ncbi:putative collagen adhesion protein [Gottschalkia acidurici 9a]|uniref:Collagen adhesion protein n=1 Tax=Gottschalkia acidurici (strain ATCC 7906 / DSM 604 / BCRC 14475 / CIP 104303 / KCTC 5404 / NCIMB 10678 / 9a) TaxID=1128398 RepID=K0AVS6_GOTA9|nr:collagen binding domain-containing protein [Gottschalkia acidurici]AFS77374.1 putative collagen adhesion protein [Gottschalkia acidurici 9a]
MKFIKNKRFNLHIIIMIIALVLQLVAPTFSYNSFAESVNSEVNESNDNLDLEEEDVAKDTEIDNSELESEPPEGEDDSEESTVGKFTSEEYSEEETIEEKDIQVPNDLGLMNYDINSLLESPKYIDSIKNVKLSYYSNGKEIVLNPDEPLDQNVEVKISYIWELSDQEKVNDGDYTEVKLPDIFEIYNEVNGRLSVSGGESAGTYKLSKDGTLRLTFNDYADNLYGVEGYVNFETSFDRGNLKGENPKVIKFPINESQTTGITIKFKPNNVSGPVQKSGVPNKTVNANEITWTIDVNKSLNGVKNALIEDTFDTGMSFKTGSMRINKLKVDLDGKATLGEEISGLTPQISGDGFTLNLGDISDAYRIEYKTEIEDFEKTSFKNVAKFNGGSSSPTVTINRGSVIEKNGETDRSFNADKITWTVYVNKSESKINSGVLTDIYGEGLKLNESTVKVYELTLDNNGNENSANQITTGFTKNHYENEKKLEIEFGGEINKAYKIIYETEIIDKEKTSFKNNAEFEGGKVSKTINISIGEKLKKSGTANISYNDAKYINWTIDMNGRELSINDAQLIDIIGNGLELVPGTITVKEISYSSNGSVNVGSNVTTSFTINENSDKKGFNLKLGDINKAYRIEYETKITDHDSLSIYENDVNLSGVGIGIDKKATVTPTIQNTFEKSGRGIDYSNNTMSWRIRVNPTKVGIKGLTITDTFPKDGLKMLEDTLIVKKGSTTLTEGTEYTIEATDDDWKKGFILKFNNYEVNEAIYEITYKTEFDRPSHKDYRENALNGKLRYENTASFAWEGGSTSRNANQTIIDVAGNNGEKSGRLMSRESKEIEWTVDLNYLSENLGSITLNDNISDDQELITDSIEIYEYSVVSTGDRTRGNSVDKSEYEINTNNKKGFDITFKDVNKPYRVVFKTKIIKSITQSNYENTANVGNIGYSASVSYNDSEKFVEKSGKQNGKNIDWKIDVNKSLSRIQDATLIDESTGGHLVKEDSFKVYETKNPTKILEKGVDYNLDVSEEVWTDTSKTQNFELNFTNTIDTMYTVEYQTEIIVLENGTNLTNKVYFKGEGQNQLGSPDQGNVQIRLTSGDGSAIGEFGSLTINKVDGHDETALEGVEFTIYNSRGKSMKTLNTNNKGVIYLPSLFYGEYTLRETKMIDGYQALEEDIKVTINKKDTEQTIKNYKLGVLEVLKIDGRDDTKLSGGEFEVKDSEGNVIGTITTGIDGKATLDGLEFGTYTVKETKSPQGYELDTKEYTIEVTKEKVNKPILLEVKNYSQVSLEILKVDSEDESKLLSGAVFEVRDLGGKRVGSVITDTNGKGKIDNLSLGKYTFIETKAPSGYKLDTTRYELNVDENSSKLIELKIQNEKRPETPQNPESEFGKLKIIKVDSEDIDIKLQGAQFEVRNSSGKLIKTVVTDMNGMAIIENLPFGEYLIKETKAPNLYKMDDTEYTVTIDRSNVTDALEIELKNFKKSQDSVGRLKITKVDSKDLATFLFGAVFEIRDSDGYLIQTLITDNDGVAISEELSFGNYTVVETKAPIGYKLNTTKHNVTINGTNIDKIALLEVKNIKLTSPPIDPVDPTDSENKERPREKRRSKEKDKPTNPQEEKIPEETTDPEHPLYPIDSENPNNQLETDDQDESVDIENIEESIKPSEIEKQIKLEETKGLLNANAQIQDETKAKEVLPKTGEMKKTVFYILGTLLILSGILIRKRTYN